MNSTEFIRTKPFLCYLAPIILFFFINLVFEINSNIKFKRSDMKKYYPILIISLINVLDSTAQNYYDLEVNNIKARVNNNINLFNKNSIQDGGFESILNGYTSSIYSSSLWIGAELPDGGLAVAAERNYNPIEKDFFFGPVADNSMGLDFQSYNRVFPINISDINQHIAWHNCLQNQSCDISLSFPNYSISQSIIDWPAHGNVSNGESFYLAPFEDVDGDGVYNPENGDYPKMKGDEAVFYILNDMKVHNVSGGASLGIEVQVMVYSYDTNIESINNTVYVNYKIYNRSKVVNFSTVKIGVYTDFDIVCPSNDFLGCDTNRNMYYGYNSILNDSLNISQNSCSPETAGAPAQGVKFLNEAMDRFSYYGSSGGGTGAPTTAPYYWPTQFYNYLSSGWKDGSSLYYGGDGYYGNTGVTNVQSNYAFSSNPSSAGGWTQTEDGDVKGLGIIEKQNFNGGDVICFDLAYIFNLDKTVSNLENVNQLLVASDEVQNFYENNQLGCDHLFTSVGEEKSQVIEPLVYPNPFSDKTTISFNRNIEEGKLDLFNSLGQKVNSFELQNKKELMISRRDLNRGVYFYQVSDRKGVFFTGKLIVK